MFSKLWNNAVLTSAVDFYCLPCESHLRSDFEADLHIAKPVHRKALEATPYYDSYKEDRIRKVPSGYYCELCNLLFTTSSKVNLHVAESIHRSRKSQIYIKRDGNSIVVFGSILISEKAWNGFRNTTCVVCNKDFQCENIHKSDKEHIIKLIQSVVEFGEKNSVYRQTADDHMQCLTCNTEFPQNTSQSHFSSTEHNNLYEASKVAIANVLDENENKIKTKAEPIIVPKIEKEETIKIDTERSKEAIKKEQPARKDEKDVKTHTEKKEVKVNQKASSNESSKSQDPYLVDKQFCELLNADNYISVLDHTFCVLCEVDITDSKALHLASITHRRLVKLHQRRLALLKESRVSDSHDDVTSEQKEQESNKEIPINDTNASSASTKSNDNILEHISEFSKQGININFESSVATCKTCKKDLDFDYDFITNHIEEHNTIKNKFDLNKYKDEAQNTSLFTEPVTMKKVAAPTMNSANKEMIEFAKKHGLEFKDNMYFCELCGVNLSVSFKQLQVHVKGKGHKTRLLIRSRQATPERRLVLASSKVPMKDFIQDMIEIEDIGFSDLVINFKYCVNIISFFMYTRHGVDRFRCQVCRINLSIHEVDTHKKKPEHREKMENTPVLTSIPDEFIREVQPGVLHCGYCNFAVNEADMSHHIASTSHREVKRGMMARLHQYLPHIQDRRRQQANMEAMLFQVMMRAMLNREF